MLSIFDVPFLDSIPPPCPLLPPQHPSLPKTLHHIGDRPAQRDRRVGLFPHLLLRGQALLHVGHLGMGAGKTRLSHYEAEPRHQIICAYGILVRGGSGSAQLWTPTRGRRGGR